MLIIVQVQPSEAQDLAAMWPLLLALLGDWHSHDDTDVGVAEV